MVRFIQATVYGTFLCIFWFTIDASYASSNPETTSSQSLIKQQIAQSEKALLDLEVLVKECGDCSEEVRIAGSLTELRQYIAFLRVRLDSIRSEIAQQKPAPKVEEQQPVSRYEQPATDKPVETAPVAVAVTATAPTVAPTPIASVHAEPAPQQAIASTSVSVQALEQRMDEMYNAIVEIRNHLNAPATPVEDLNLVASRGATYAPRPKEAPATMSSPTAVTSPAPVAPNAAPAGGVNLSELNYKLDGRGYFAYRHDATDGDGQSNEFEMARMMFGLKYFASDDLTLRYLTDIARESGNGKIDAQAQLAYVDWKVDKRLNLLVGLQLTNNWAQTEVTWGYRSILWSPMEAFGDYWGAWNKKYITYLEAWALADPTKAGLLSNQITASRSKMGAAADMAVGASYKPVKSVFVNFQIRNGSGYKSAENDMFKNFQLMVGKSFMNNAVNVSAFTELEPYRGLDENGDSKGFVNVAWDVSASYTEKDKFTVGTSVNSKTFASTESITGTSVSGFFHGFLKPNKLKAIARYDVYNTGFNDAVVRPGDKAFESNGNRMVLGLDYLAHKNFSIIPNLQVVSYENSDMKPVKSAYVHMAFKW